MRVIDIPGRLTCPHQYQKNAFWTHCIVCCSHGIWSNFKLAMTVSNVTVIIHYGILCVACTLGPEDMKAFAEKINSQSSFGCLENVVISAAVERNK